MTHCLRRKRNRMPEQNSSDTLLRTGKKKSGKKKNQVVRFKHCDFLFLLSISGIWPGPEAAVLKCYRMKKNVSSVLLA